MFNKFSTRFQNRFAYQFRSSNARKKNRISSENGLWLETRHFSSFSPSILMNKSLHGAAEDRTRNSTTPQLICLRHGLAIPSLVDPIFWTFSFIILSIVGSPATSRPCMRYLRSKFAYDCRNQEKYFISMNGQYLKIR